MTTNPCSFSSPRYYVTVTNADSTSYTCSSCLYVRCLCLREHRHSYNSEVTFLGLACRLLSVLAPGRSYHKEWEH